MICSATLKTTLMLALMLFDFPVYSSLYIQALPFVLFSVQAFQRYQKELAVTESFELIIIIGTRWSSHLNL